MSEAGPTSDTTPANATSEASVGVGRQRGQPMQDADVKCHGPPFTMRIPACATQQVLLVAKGPDLLFGMPPKFDGFPSISSRTL